MKKKFYGALLLGSVLLTGGMVSCSLIPQHYYKIFFLST